MTDCDLCGLPPDQSQALARCATCNALCCITCRQLRYGHQPECTWCSDERARAQIQLVVMEVEKNILPRDQRRPFDWQPTHDRGIA